MKTNGQLSGVLHVLLHMAEHEGAMTSERLAKALSTNPVVIRRILARLRDRGYVRSDKGHGGGWILACNLRDVTLRDIHTALGSPVVLALGHWSESPDCLVEQAVNHALSQAFHDAEALLMERLGNVTLESLSADVHTRLAARRQAHGMEDMHRSPKAVS